MLVLASKDSGTVLPLVIGRSEALAIQVRLSHAEPPRPLTHDLLEHAIAALGGRVVEVEIDGIRNAAFGAKVHLAQGPKRVELDARPSDSVALALRVSAPIYARRQVLDDAGLSKRDLDRLRRRQRPGASGEASPPVSL